MVLTFAKWNVFAIFFWKSKVEGKHGRAECRKRETCKWQMVPCSASWIASDDSPLLIFLSSVSSITGKLSKQLSFMIFLVYIFFISALYFIFLPLECSTCENLEDMFNGFAVAACSLRLYNTGHNFRRFLVLHSHYERCFLNSKHHSYFLLLNDIHHF